jgi:hypothetical protein
MANTDRSRTPFQVVVYTPVPTVTSGPSVSDCLDAAFARWIAFLADIAAADILNRSSFTPAATAPTGRGDGPVDLLGDQALVGIPGVCHAIS